MKLLKRHRKLSYIGNKLIFTLFKELSGLGGRMENLIIKNKSYTDAVYHNEQR